MLSLSFSIFCLLFLFLKHCHFFDCGCCIVRILSLKISNLSHTLMGWEGRVTEVNGNSNDQVTMPAFSKKILHSMFSFMFSLHTKKKQKNQYFCLWALAIKHFLCYLLFFFVCKNNRFLTFMICSIFIHETIFFFRLICTIIITIAGPFLVSNIILMVCIF